MHQILFCVENENLRSRLWTNVIAHTSVQVFIKWMRQQQNVQVFDLLAGLKHYDIDDYASEKIMLASVKYLYLMTR